MRTVLKRVNQLTNETRPAHSPRLHRRWGSPTRASFVAMSVVALALPVTATAAAPTLGPWLTVTLDSMGDVGRFASLAINASGYPVVAYHDLGPDPTNSLDEFKERDDLKDNLKLAACSDPSCSTNPVTVSTVYTRGRIGSDVSLVLDASGNPVIAHRQTTGRDLFLQVCGDATCSPGSVLTNGVNDLGDRGQDLSLTLGTLGYPVIVDFHRQIERLLLTVCGDALCSEEALTESEVDRGLWRLSDGHVAINPSGNPVVAYRRDIFNVGTPMMLLICGDAVCSLDTRTYATIDPSAAGLDAMVLDQSGFPVLASTRLTTSTVLSETVETYSVVITRCGDALCSTDGLTTTTVASSGTSVLGDVQLVLDDNDNPVITYIERDPGTSSNLTVAACGDRACSAGNVAISAVNSDGSFVVHPSLALDNLGNPVIAYQDAISDNLKISTMIAGALCQGQSPTIMGSGVISGTAGDDVILGSDGNDTIRSFGGNDTICGGDGDDIIRASRGNDIISGGRGNDTIYGGSGNDLIFADADNDTILGGAGNDEIHGGRGNDVIDAGNNNDRIYAGDGNDVVRAGSGADELFGEAGDDALDGGNGNDLLVGGAGADDLVGGGGKDTVTYIDSTGPVNVSINATANDGEAGERDNVALSVETVVGTVFDDVLIGSNSANTLRGLTGNDTLRGVGGSDLLVGGSGNDTLFGGGAADTLTAGNGVDVCRGGNDTDQFNGCETEIQ